MSKRVAVVHDFCFQYGGGEKVVEKFLEMYPEADLITSIFVPSKFTSSEIFTTFYNSNKIKITWLNGIFNWNNGFLLSYFKHFFWLYPLVMRSVILRDYDLVLISSTDCGKQIRFNNSPKILHYCHTPTRYLHGLVDSDNYKIGFIQKFLLPIFVFLLRPLDLKAVEYLNSKKCIWVANSIFVQSLIKEVYDTDSVVVYPPIEVEKFLNLKRGDGSSSVENEGILKQVQDDAMGMSSEPENSPLEGWQAKPDGVICSVEEVEILGSVSSIEPFYLCHGRISFHKRIDLAIRACLELGVHLKISGTSGLPKEMQDLQKIIDDYVVQFPAKKGLVELLGRTTNEQANELISTCKAFIFPGKEDFGIAPVEMLAAGVPLIAYQLGGALEYVREGVNGVFFNEQTVESLVKALLDFEKIKNWDYVKIRASSMSFDQNIFESKIYSFTK